MKPTIRKITINLDTYWIVKFQRGLYYMPKPDTLKCNFCKKNIKGNVFIYRTNKEDCYASCLTCIDEANRRKIGKTEYQTLTIRLFKNV
jgi:hypothetical protein